MASGDAVVSAGGAVVVDENGNAVTAAGTVTYGTASSTPYTLPSAVTSGQLWLMGAAALLFLALVALPPVLSRRLRSGGSTRV